MTPLILAAVLAWRVLLPDVPVGAGPAPTALLLVGDSMTYDRQFLPDDRAGVYVVRGRAAFGGWRAGDLLKSVTGVCVDTNAPTETVLQCEIDRAHASAALVMLGTNDVVFDTPTDQYRANLTRVVDLLLASGARPTLSTIPPIRRETVQGGRVPEINDTIRAVAAARGLTVIDYWAAMQGLPDQGIGDDGIHPSAAGYALRSRLAEAALAGRH